MTQSRFNPLIRIQGNNTDDQLGISVASAGDVNNDGYSDIIVGARKGDPGGRSAAGEAYVIYGGASLSNVDLSVTLASSQGFKILGGTRNDQLGISVASAGDVNNDGYSDIIVGAYWADPGGRSAAGEAYVIYGGASLSNVDLSVTLASSQGFKILGGTRNDQLGISVASAGDVNNDGYSDIIVGAYWADPGGRSAAGETYVIYGGSTLNDVDLSVTLASSQGFKILGDNSGDYLGISVASAGNVNNDGYSDIIVGAYWADPGGRTSAGEAYVIYGGASLSDVDLSNSLASSTGFKILGDNINDQLGISVASAGDVNNDGYSDIIVGAYWADPGGRTSAGEAYVIYGGASLSDVDLSNSLASSTGFKILGNNPSDRLGYSVASAGDVNNDGYSDIIVGAYWADPGGRTSAGEAYVIYGGAFLMSR